MATGFLLMSIGAFGLSAIEVVETTVKLFSMF